MTKVKILIWSLISWGVIPSQVLAGEIWGYPISPVQAKFYLIILGVIAFSILMVASVYALFWLLDFKKKAKESLMVKSLGAELVNLKNKYALAK
ncbi:MAG: hypothetical protein ACPL5I_00860 [Thermodesulfobacteriota bacterium]